MRFLVRVGPASKYPHESTYPNRRNAPLRQLADRVEALVYVTAHEVEHLDQFSQGGSRREQATDLVALKILDTFRSQREALWAEWTAAEVVEPPASLPMPNVRQAKAQAALEKWERKLKLAKTKVRKYRRRVTYYERRGMAAMKC